MSRLNQGSDQRLDQRLDEELRNAFRREQPSVDFTMRVLERVSLEPSPRVTWWQKLAMLFEPPKLRWVAIGVTASLLLAIGAMQYTRLHRGMINDSGAVATGGPSSEASGQGTGGKDAVNSGVGQSRKEAVTNTPAPITKRDLTLATNHRRVLARHPQDQQLRAEGEAAKEKLMLALAIASSALSDAQKAVHDDGLQP